MTAILANATAKDRPGTDLYPTPSNVTVALLQYLELPTGSRIWEPACGRGDMAMVLEAAGHTVISSDLHTFYGHGGRDFLNCKPVVCDWIITNPPFSLATEFIMRALDLNVPFALLLKSQFWHSARRRELFMRHLPTAVLPLTWRPDFHFGAKGGSPTMECLWTIWSRHPARFTHYYPLPKPRD